MGTPEWRSVLEQQLRQHAKSSVYAFATASPAPHVRYVVHRECECSFRVSSPLSTESHSSRWSHPG